jgi:hypothetical protein
MGGMARPRSGRGELYKMMPKQDSAEHQMQDSCSTVGLLKRGEGGGEEEKTTSRRLRMENERLAGKA